MKTLMGEAKLSSLGDVWVWPETQRNTCEFCIRISWKERFVQFIEKLFYSLILVVSAKIFTDIPNRYDHVTSSHELIFWMTFSFASMFLPGR